MQPLFTMFQGGENILFFNTLCLGAENPNFPYPIIIFIIQKFFFSNKRRNDILIFLVYIDKYCSRLLEIVQKSICKNVSSSVVILISLSVKSNLGLDFSCNIKGPCTKYIHNCFSCIWLKPKVLKVLRRTEK